MEKKDHLLGCSKAAAIIQIFTRYPKKGEISFWCLKNLVKKTHTCFFFRNPNANLEVQVHECLVSILIQKWWIGWKIKRCPESNPSNYLPNDFEGNPKLFISIQWSFEVPQNFRVIYQKHPEILRRFFQNSNSLKATGTPHRMMLPCQGFNGVASTTHLSSGRSSSWRLQADPMFELVGKTHQLGGFGATSDLETIFCTCCWWWVCIQDSSQTNKPPENLFISTWNLKEPFFWWMDMVISNHFPCKGWVHHPI